MPTKSTILLDSNSRHRRITGVQAFHDAGYYGSRVYAGTGECWNINGYNPDRLIVDPLGRGTIGGTDTHAVHTASVFFQVAPQAHLVMLNWGGTFKGDGSYSSHFFDDSVDVIEKYNIADSFCSFTHSGNTNYFNDMSKKLQELQTFKSFWSAGNADTDSYSKVMQVDEVFGVGAYRIMVDGQIVLEHFSSESEYLDFAAPDMIYTNINADSADASCAPNTGTSFSSPWLCGMACLVDDFFIDKTGKPLTIQAMYQFLKDYSMDIGDEGFDVETGFGAPCLPNPYSIDIEKYAQGGGDTPLITITSTETNNTKQPFDVIKIDDYKCTIEKIPYDSIDNIDIAKCKDNTETLGSFYNRQDVKPDIMTNGGLFTLTTGKNVMSFIDEGVEQNYQNNFEGFGTKYNTVNKIVYGIDKDGDWKDFITAYPILIKNGNKTQSSEWGNATSINTNAARQCYAYDDNYLYIITIDEKVKFETVQDIMETLGVTYGFNVDGGGSVRTMVLGEIVNAPTENRGVDNVICIYLKDKEVTEPEEPEEPEQPEELPTIVAGDYIVQSSTDICVGVEDGSKVLSTAFKGDVITLLGAILKYEDDYFVSCSFNGDVGWCVYVETNFVPASETPENPSYSLPAVYIVEVNTTLNVRESPNGTILGVLYPQDEIVVYEISNGWAKFKYDIGNIEYAYCSTQYISYAYQYEEPEAPNDPDEPKEDFELDYTVLDTYTDKNNISRWAKDAVTYCVQKGYLTGSDNKISPKDPLTREQFCTVIYRILEGDK